ncbi:MAG: transglutaminaseTgpA domain-containing protein [Prosthecobacter sp.]
MKTRVRWNRHTLALAAVVGGMWYAAEAQSNGAAHLIALLAGAMGALSWLHARANLRGLNVRLAGARPSAQDETRRIVVELRAEGSVVPCGLQVQAAGAEKSVFVERVPLGSVTRVELPPPKGTAQRALRIVVRSVYPLGLFTAEAMLQTSWIRRVHPKPAGDLPLPAPDFNLQGDAAVVAMTTGRSSEGDDFAGLREWRAGDSPRQIDWRAVARGGPLMSKTWGSSLQGVVVLDWDAWKLEPDARASQFARWMEQCESAGHPYALRLPQAAIQAGLGPAHMRRCLDLLAAQTNTEEGTATAREWKEDATRGDIGFEHEAHLPARPLLLLSLALLLAIWPLHGHITTSAILVCAMSLVWRGPLRMGVPHVMARLSVIAAGTAAVWTEYDGLEGMEPGIAMLLVLAGAKMLESRTPRDFQIMALIGWFLAFCLLLLDNQLSRAVWVTGVFLLIAGCMARFRRNTPGAREPLRTTAVLFAQAIPLALMLFFVFPRGLLNLGGALGRSRFGETGIDATLDPGKIATLALSSDVAFRVRFPDGPPPPVEQRYWRCLTLWDCDGLRWRRGPRMGHVTFPQRPEPGSDVRQVIDLEPHGKNWVPALDRPLRATARRILLLPDYDDSITSPVKVINAERIEVWSRLQLPPLRELPAHHREAALKVPEGISPRLQQLVDSWRAAATNDEEIVQQVIEHFRTQRFTYTLDPGEYSDDSLDEFLFERRTGFCEHFSASFATLLRIAGVPSRVIVGYLGGEYSDHNGGYLIVKQSEVHAWTEVWLERYGWQRIDPTAALAPDRVNIDLRAWLAGGAEAAERQRRSLWWRTTQRIRLLWDSLSYAWQDEVIDFDQESQRNLLESLGLVRGRHGILLAASALGIFLFAYGVAWWLRRPTRTSDPWLSAWRRACMKLARAGVRPRLANEGPLAYAECVSRSRPDLAEATSRLAELYASGRYGGGEDGFQEFKALQASFKPRRNVRP